METTGCECPYVEEKEDEEEAQEQEQKEQEQGFCVQTLWPGTRGTGTRMISTDPFAFFACGLSRWRMSPRAGEQPVRFWTHGVQQYCRAGAPGTSTPSSLKCLDSNTATST